MQNAKAERGPRGRYARLICRGCRSRKIKRNLPDIALDELGPLGSTRTPEKSCERCRNLSLECIVERTTLGRPSRKRNGSESSRGASPVSRNHSNSQNDGDSPPIASLEIKDYLATESIDDLGTTEQSQMLGEQRLFRSIVEFQYFFSSVLAKDRVFGATIPRSTAGWTTPLPELVSHELATALDNNLVWHQFFLPGLPSLVSVRNRLELDGEEDISTNPATNLLFALLCLMAVDTTDKFDRQHPRLKRNVQLAISSYGQEFIFSPPTHRDSVMVCILLAEYRPTAVVVSQHIAHKAIKSTLYLNIAFKIAEQLEILPSQLNLSVRDLTTISDAEFEHKVTDSLQGLKILSQDIALEGLLSNPVRSLQKVLDSMTTHIQAYQDILKRRRCSPRVIFQIQWEIASYMFLDGVKSTKQSWGSAEKMYHVVEEMEEKCLAQQSFCDWALTNSAALGTPEELSAARSILEERFHAVISRIYGLALLYMSVLKSRTLSNISQGDLEIYPGETVRIGTHVFHTLNNISDETDEQLATFVRRFGKVFPDRLLRVLEMFIQCADLKLSGVPFQAPFRDIILDMLVFSRSITENNGIHVRNLDGKMRENSDYQIEVMVKATKRIEMMVASPGKSVEAAFAGGCVYAASIKVMAALVDIMRNLKKKMSDANVGQNLSSMPDTSTDWIPSGPAEDPPWESWNLWPDDGIPNPSDLGRFVFDGFPVIDPDGGMDLDLSLDLTWI